MNRVDLSLINKYAIIYEHYLNHAKTLLLLSGFQSGKRSKLF